MLSVLSELDARVHVDNLELVDGDLYDVSFEETIELVRPVINLF